jgi:hypothetical protein
MNNPVNQQGMAALQGIGRCIARYRRDTRAMKKITMHYDRRVSALLQKVGELAAEADVAKAPKDREYYWRQSQEYFQKALVDFDLARPAVSKKY